MKHFLKNILLVLAGIIFVLILAELSLRMAGKIYYASRIKNEALRPQDKDAIRILCLGDSYTFGMGADKGYSYPEQLERILNANNPQKNFIVYNAGVPGNTSSKLLSHLDENLERYRPHILIVMIGMNDNYCIEETNYFLFKDYGLKSILYRIDYYFSQLRVYKLLKRGMDNLEIARWRNKLIAKYISTGALASLQSKNSRFQVADEKIINEFSMHIKLGNQYFNDRARQVALAIEEFKKATEIIPNNEEAYISLAAIYMGLNKWESAIAQLKKALGINPYNKEIFNKLWMAYYNDGKEKLAQEALEKYLCLSPQDLHTYLPFLKYGLPGGEDIVTFDKLLRFNLKTINERVKIKGIKLVFQNYPYFEDWTAVVKEVALQNQICFVDHLAIFRKMRLETAYKNTDYFAQDGHCNNKGYFVMVENINNAIKENKILKIN